MTTPTLLAFFLGALSWTFLEYVIHRWLGHDRRLVRKTPFGTEHTAHHSQGGYFAASWKKGVVALIVLATLGPVASLIAGTTLGVVYTVSLVGAYLVYELVHRLLHTWAGVGPYARWARRHHFFHHFHDPSKNHGVTSPFWDLVFGTRVQIGREPIQVPEKLAMRWLRDASTGEVKASLAADYNLRRRPG